MIRRQRRIGDERLCAKGGARQAFSALAKKPTGSLDPLHDLAWNNRSKRRDRIFIEDTPRKIGAPATMLFEGYSIGPPSSWPLEQFRPSPVGARAAVARVPLHVEPPCRRGGKTPARQEFPSSAVRLRFARVDPDAQIHEIATSRATGSPDNDLWLRPG